MLTARQREVMALVAEGFSDKEIANRLGITWFTARKHRDDAVQALHARNKSHAAVLYALQAAR